MSNPVCVIDAHMDMHFQALNEAVKSAPAGELLVERCNGQRYLGCGLTAAKTVTIQGTPGNALGAYLSGATLRVEGNAQDAVGDTMDSGAILIHGRCGDAVGYGMRGGRILVEGDVGYRGGIHMKAYKDKVPVLIVGGRAGSFLGEYQAGGVILVLGLGGDGSAPVGYFCGTGMHGGKIILRCTQPPAGLPGQIACRKAGPEDLAEISSLVEEYAREFGVPVQTILESNFYLLTPNSKNPYKQLYTHS